MNRPYLHILLSNNYNRHNTIHRNISKRYLKWRQSSAPSPSIPIGRHHYCRHPCWYSNTTGQHRSIQHPRSFMKNTSLCQSYDERSIMQQQSKPRMLHDDIHRMDRLATQRQQQWRTITTETTRPKRNDVDAGSTTDPGPDLPYDKNENNDLLPSRARPVGPQSPFRQHSLLNGQLAVVSFYDSHGDYHKDEKMIREYRKQQLPVSHGEVIEDCEIEDTIPSLPIPSLHDTLVKLQSSCPPLFQREKELHEFVLALQKALTQPMVSYQKRLLLRGEKATTQKTSWLQSWWNTNCYLNVRTSNVVHSSYFFRFPEPLRLACSDNTNDMMHNPIDDVTTTTDVGQSPTTGAASNNRFHCKTTLERATTLIYGALQYSYPFLFGNGVPKTDPSRTKNMLCEAQYKYMFGACRIPGLQSDTYRLYQYSSQDRSKLPHVTVVCRGQFYNLIIGDYSGPDAQVVLRPTEGNVIDAATTMHMIHDQLMAIVDDARRNSPTTVNSLLVENGVPELGWLTTQNRDDWYKDYQWLVKNPAMQDALHVLQSSLLVLCLDDLSDTNRILDELMATNDFAKRLWHGGRDDMFRFPSQQMGGNRFYDKSIQIVMTLGNIRGDETSDSDVSFGLIGEHSMADGMPVAEFSRYLNQCEDHFRLKLIPFFNAIDVSRANHDNGEDSRENLNNRGENHDEDDDSRENHNASATTTQAARVHNIFHDAYKGLSEADQKYLHGRVNEARYNHISITNLYELEVVNTEFLPLDKFVFEDPNESDITGLGSRFFKLMKLSPDAGTQMVMQLASYRFFGHTVATYESTQTRRFRHGRTETIRTVTGRSHEFCRNLTKAFQKLESKRPPMAPQPIVNDLSPSKQEEIVKALRLACESHTNYSRMAAHGQGCDRHLFGLELLANRTLNDHIAEERKALIRSGAPPDTPLPDELIKTLEQRIIPTLFKDPVYLRSKRWRLSTSTLPGTAPGFGPVVEDGLGIGYDVGMDHTIFTVTGLRSENDVGRFCDELEMAVMDVHQLLFNAFVKEREAMKQNEVS